MTVLDSKFSRFASGGDLIAGDIVVGLRDGLNTKFNNTGGVGTFLPLLGGTMLGAIVMGGFKITDLGTPTDPADAVTKTYADLMLPLAGGIMSGIINMNSHKITNLTDPSSAQDAATKAYVDSTGSGTVSPGLINQLAYYAAAGSTVSGIATANSGTLITSAGGVPSISSILPSAVQLNITALGTISTGTWNGTVIGATYGGTGVASPTAHGIMVAEGSSAMTPIVLTTGQILIGSTGVDPVAAAINSGAGILVGNGAGSITVQLAAIADHTLLANISGGSLAPSSTTLTALIDNAIGSTQGDLLYRNATTWAVLAPGSAGQLLKTGGAAANPAWTTATFPATGGAAGNILISDGTNYIASTSLWPNTVGTAGTILRSNGTSNAYTTTTFADTYSASTILYSNGANTVAGLATANSSVLVTTSAGVPVQSGTMTNGQIIIGSTGATPVVASLSAGTGISITPGAGTISIATTGAVVTPAALSKGDDANVTLTLTGTPTTAVLQATTITAGWTGQLSVARGGTGLAAITAHDLIIGNGTSAATLLAPSATSGVPLISQGASSDPAYGTAVVGGGGTGNTTFTAYSVLCAGTTATGAFQNVSGVGTSGQVLQSNGAAALPTWATIPGATSAALTKADDTNVTLTLGGAPTTALLTAASITAGWTGQLGLTRGGTAASLTASNGGIVYSSASALAILGGTATANQILMSGSSTTPAWSTATYPATAGTSGNYIKSNGTNFSSAAFTARTQQILTTGSGTYSTPAGVLYIEVEMCGAGAGGSGSGTGGGNAGSTPSDTTFGSAFLTCHGGTCTGSLASQSPSAGGTATGGDINLQGNGGSTNAVASANATVGNCLGGNGGNGFGGYGGGMATNGGNNGNAATGYGAGGGGAGGTSTLFAGQGGGAGGYLRKLITSPSASYAYSVTAGSAGGTAGSSGHAGGAGSDGIIIVREFYA